MSDDVPECCTKREGRNGSPVRVTFETFWNDTRDCCERVLQHALLPALSESFAELSCSSCRVGLGGLNLHKVVGLMAGKRFALPVPPLL